MKLKQLHLIVLLLAVLSNGCAQFHAVLTDTTTDTNGVTQIKRTDIHSATLFDSKSELAKLKSLVSDKTQSLGLGSLNQESTSTNLNHIIESIASGIVKGLKTTP